MAKLTQQSFETKHAGQERNKKRKKKTFLLHSFTAFVPDLLKETVIVSTLCIVNAQIINVVLNVGSGGA